MSRLSILFGTLLIILGAVGYFIQEPGARSLTAFIPAAFGLLLILPGLIAAAKPSLNKHMMHVAALVGLLGAAGGLGMGLPKLIKGDMLRPLAVYSQLTMGALCLIFVILCIRSFVKARLLRKGY
ncbi:MAG: hypothetical protein V4733_07395 [Verrucomicrobiota bacterium]